MKSCKIINGKLRCLEDELGQSNLVSQNEVGDVSPIPIEETAFKASATYNSVVREETAKKDMKIEETASNSSKDLLHPLIGNHITKANFIGEIPELVREKAIMTQGSSEYFESRLNESHVNEYLNKNGLSQKYTVDFGSSNNDALVYVNNKSGKATISFRGTQPTNLRDWYENLNFGLIDFKKHPTETIYGKRVKELYNNVVEQYDIEHITGFSKGGFGAITLGDHANIETTTFSPAVSIGHLRTSKNNKHNIWNTSEDIVSVFANPLKLKNKNVKVNTVDPLEEFDTINPADTHNLDNYINKKNTQGIVIPRRVNHTSKLTKEYLNISNFQEELEASRFAQHFMDKRMSFTDYLSQVANKDVNILDNTLSKNIQRNGLYHKVWKELGGSFSQVEAEHLTRSAESNYKPISSKLERIDHARAPPQFQMKQRNEMAEEKASIEKNIQELNRAHTEPLRKIGAAHLGRGIATAGLGSLAGNALGFIVNDEKLLAGNIPIIGGEIEQELQAIKENVKPFTDIIPDLVKDDFNPFGTGAAMAAITGGSIFMEGTAAVGTYEIDKLVGEGAKHIASLVTDNEDIQKHAQIVTEGAAAPSLFSGILTSLSVGLRAVGAVESVVPLPQAEMLGALTIGGAFAAEALAQVM